MIIISVRHTVSNSRERDVEKLVESLWPWCVNRISSVPYLEVYLWAGGATSVESWTQRLSTQWPGSWTWNRFRCRWRTASGWTVPCSKTVDCSEMFDYIKALNKIIVTQLVAEVVACWTRCVTKATVSFHLPKTFCLIDATRPLLLFQVTLFVAEVVVSSSIFLIWYAEIYWDVLLTQDFLRWFRGPQAWLAQSFTALIFDWNKAKERKKNFSRRNMTSNILAWTEWKVADLLMYQCPGIFEPIF